VGSVGAAAGAGRQYLESSTNLLVASNWVTIATNMLPFWPPDTNVWLRDSTSSNEFFRILQK
jgi:hypothetical protein